MVIRVEEAYSRALQKSRNEKNKYSIIFSTTLHPNTYRLGWIIQKHSHIRSSGPAESKHSKECLYMQMLNQCPDFVKTWRCRGCAQCYNMVTVLFIHTLGKSILLMMSSHVALMSFIWSIVLVDYPIMAKHHNH